MHLPEIYAQPKKGTENFIDKDEVLNFNLIDFWRWNQSDLIENRTRGILAEFIVKQALNIKSENRIEWDNFDLTTNSGKKIEVKSAAYIQSWEQEKFSDIKFGIAQTRGTEDHPDYDGTKKRWADFYVFCLLKHQNQRNINPLDMSQWTFYVLKTEILNKYVLEQKTIGLNALLELNPTVCKYSDLMSVIENNHTLP